MNFDILKVKKLIIYFFKVLRPMSHKYESLGTKLVI